MHGVASIRYNEDMLHRLLLVFSLALMLGLGQLGTAVHAVSHLAESQQQGDTRDSKSHHLSFCGLCAAYAAVDGALEVGTHLIAPHAAVVHTPRLRAVASPDFTPLPYQARAPPIHA